MPYFAPFYLSSVCLVITPSLIDVICAFQRKIPAPGFQVEVVMIDYNGTLHARTKVNPTGKGSDGSTGNVSASGARPASNSSKVPADRDDDVFSDSDDEESRNSAIRKAQAASQPNFPAHRPVSEATSDRVEALTRGTDQLSLKHEKRAQEDGSRKSNTGEGVQETPPCPKSTNLESAGANDFKAIAADASVFSFGDEDFESE